MAIGLLFYFNHVSWSCLTKAPKKYYYILVEQEYNSNHSHRHKYNFVTFKYIINDSKAMISMIIGDVSQIWLLCQNTEPLNKILICMQKREI